MFVFLKFISSVVPTIEYDFTMDLELEWMNAQVICNCYIF
jgi:hypothetical protein